MTVSEDLRHALSPALRARYSLGWEPDPLQERILTPMASDLVLNCTCQWGKATRRSWRVSLCLRRAECCGSERLALELAENSDVHFCERG